MQTAIEIESLSKIYRKRRGEDIRAVDDLALSVPAGQIFGFLGPNGAGKTTSIKMVCGLVTPSSGRVYLNGFDVNRQRGNAMRQTGAVLEGTRNVYWRLSPWENLMYFGRLKGVWGSRLRERAKWLLQCLDLWSRRNVAVRGFSRGMQQKLAIACALIADPPVVLLDEPTLGLDVDAARTVKAWIEELAREHGKTVLLTTHQLGMAQELCDRIAIMSKGRLIADHPVTELLALFRQHEAYEIRLKGHLNGELSAFNGLSMTYEYGDTLISGAFAEPESLHKLVGAIGSTGMPLVSVNRVEADLEEVFVQLTKKEA
jgi:ABC-2 type transport system ATP-binding protein